MAARFAVLVDVDGTLVDSNYLHVLAWSRAFRETGYDVVSADIHRRVGMGGDRLMADLIGREDEAADKAHSDRYAELWPELRALPGAGDLLRALRSRGAHVVLATSAKADEVEALRRALGADDAIDDVTSSADVSSTKPAPDIFATALASTGLPPERAVVIGDTVWDVEAAARAELPCVAVLTGGIARAELLAAGAAAVYEDARELLERLDSSPVAALF